MSSPDTGPEAAAARAFGWFQDQARHLGAGTEVRLDPLGARTLEVRVHPGRPAEVGLLARWQEPGTAGPLGVTSDVSVSALYLLEVLDQAATNPGPGVMGYAIAHDTPVTSVQPPAARPQGLGGSSRPRLVVIAAGSVPGGGVVGTTDPAFPPSPLLSLPRADATALAPDVARLLASCSEQGVAACALDPVSVRGHLSPTPAELFAAMRGAGA
ncbi:hypothetical protein [Streptomyces sp. AGS-58]|uniref:hypothetical protein n=1 Tax=unclassified Streptomyces TaxID=2593676 RepID=UPI0035A346DD